MELPFPPLRKEDNPPFPPPPQQKTTKPPDTSYIIPHPDKPGYYQCTVCHIFDSKLRHKTEEHVKECLRKQEAKKKKQEEKERIDTNLLYDLVIQLQKEVATLRQQIKDMKKQELQKINIPYWLNHHCSETLPTQTFNEWRKSQLFQPTDEQLQIVFHHDIKKGIQDVIRNVLETEDLSLFPIRAFSKQRHVFYLYEYPPPPPPTTSDTIQTTTNRTEDEEEIQDPEPEWRKMTKEEFHHWLETIQHKFLLKFEEWEQINQEWLENETNNKERTKYFEKINKELELMEPQTIRNWLYDELKRPLKRVVELEFEEL
jgi:hypothetical protein